MNRTAATKLLLGLALPAMLCLPLAAAASAEVRVHVRAVTWEGRILLDRTVRTGTTTVPTRARADCFGGSPSNGSKQIPGATALGALHDAQAQRKPRRPLLLTNAFDFGLGVCGIGNEVVEGEEWWELSHNHEPSMLGGEGTTLRRGDTVLWYKSKSFNETSPDELYLDAPRRVRRNASFRVRVMAFNDKGRSRPVKGARLSVAGSPATNARGYARLRVKRKARIVARAKDLIVSNRAVVRVRR
jgi:hypothetical protein